MKANYVSYRAIKNKNNFWDVWLIYFDDKKEIVKNNVKEKQALQFAMQMNLKNKNIVKEFGPDAII
jgi:hypothetical protein